MKPIMAKEVRSDNNDNSALEEETTESSSSLSESEDSSDSKDSAFEEDIALRVGGSESESDDDEAVQSVLQVAKFLSPPYISRTSRSVASNLKLLSYRQNVRTLINKTVHNFHVNVVQNFIDDSDLHKVLPGHSPPDYGDAAHSLVPSSRDDQVMRKNIATQI